MTKLSELQTTFKGKIVLKSKHQMFPDNHIDLHISVAYSNILPESNRDAEMHQDIALLREPDSITDLR